MAVCRYALDPARARASTGCNWEYVPGNESSRRLAVAVGFGFAEGSATTVDLHGEQREARVGMLRRDDVRR